MPNKRNEDNIKRVIYIKNTRENALPSGTKWLLFEEASLLMQKEILEQVLRKCIILKENRADCHLSKTINELYV